MKKKVLSLTLVVCLLAIAVVGGTLAYFTDTTQTENNVFTVGNVDITLDEPNWDSEGVEDAPEVYPGEALAKDPIVTNEGANPCFVRVKVDGLDCLGQAGMIQYRTNGALDTLGENWVEYEGYYYYCKVLPAEEGANVTTALFDHIIMPTGLTNGYEANYSVDVTAYAVQAQGIRPNWSTNATLGEGVADMGTDDVAEIAAWFTTCGM